MNRVNVVKMTTNFPYILILVFSVQILTGSTNSTFRKHKVHNIVLYPDKHSWCTSTSIKQVVSDVNCDSVEINNRVCLGACFSYSIPRTLPATNGNELNSYCDSCQPINTSWIPVQLTCGDGSNQTKHVQLINECRCSSCSRHWEFESPVIDADYVEETSTETSRYSELMKLKQDENAENEDDDENNNTTTDDVSNTAAAEKILQQDATTVNSTRLVYKKDIWIRGPHHSKVLLKKETVSANIADEETQQYLGDDTEDMDKLRNP